MGQRYGARSIGLNTVNDYGSDKQTSNFNEHASIATADKIAFVDRLSAANLPVIEVSAFVSPKWVPQMADASQVFAGITRAAGIRYSALVPNLAGLDRAMAAAVDEVAIFAASTEAFSRKNINQSIDESLATYKDVSDRARAAGLRVRGYLSTAFGCPYEGSVAPEKVAELTARLIDLGVFEVAVAVVAEMAMTSSGTTATAAMQAPLTLRTKTRA